MFSESFILLELFVDFRYSKFRYITNTLNLKLGIFNKLFITTINQVINNTMSLILNKLKTTLPRITRNLSAAYTTSNDEISPIFTNRNPRNLERLRIGYKPDGFYVDKPGKLFWHKLILTESSRYVTASLVHFENGEVLKVSTKEWALQKQLYKTTDTTAYINLARVFAEKCMESGLTEFLCDLEAPNEDGKVFHFLKTLRASGLCLTEPEQYKTVLPWTRERPEKPWEVFE